MRRNIRYMYAIALLQGMVFYGPVATLYREAQGVSIAQITLIESISLALVHPAGGALGGAGRQAGL